MTTREEYFKSVLRNTVRDAVQNLVRTREYSAKFLSREDPKSVDKEIERITDEVMAKFVLKLGSKGAIMPEHTLSREEFERLFRQTINEYFSESHEGKTS